MTSADVTDDEAKLAFFATELANGVELHLEAWMTRVIDERRRAGSQHQGSQLRNDGQVRIHLQAQRLIVEVRGLLASDIDEQRTNPLSVIRKAAIPIAAELDEAGVEHPRRDMDAKRLHPEDLFNVGPASFSEIHPDLHEPGLSWGAAKAHVHIQRRRAEAAIASSAAESP